MRTAVIGMVLVGLAGCNEFATGPLDAASDRTAVDVPVDDTPSADRPDLGAQTDTPATDVVDAGAPVDVPTSPDVQDAGSPIDDVPTVDIVDVPIAIDAPDVQVVMPDVPTDQPVARDVSDTGVFGIRVLSQGIVTVGPSTGSTGSLRVVEQGFEYGSRVCSGDGRTCWIGGIVP
jgi:hypothetical protein